jgi:hypothetical protein
MRSCRSPPPGRRCSAVSSEVAEGRQTGRKMVRQGGVGRLVGGAGVHREGGGSSEERCPPSRGGSTGGGGAGADSGLGRFVRG